VAETIPASEHSVMTAWPTEEQAVRRMIDQFGGDGHSFSIAFDSYDFLHALHSILPSVAQSHVDKGGVMVIRPDSGDPCECVLQALRAGESVFGVDVNTKGYKVVRQMGVIQGDGINYNTVKTISEAVMNAGYSAECVAYGQGGGLLQRVNRDTLSFATKLCFLIDSHGQSRDIAKRPKGSDGKISLPGCLRVIRHSPSSPLTVTTGEWNEEKGVVEGEGESVMRVVWDSGPVEGCWDDFDVVKERVEREWRQAPKVCDVISDQLKERIRRWVEGFQAKEGKAEERKDSEQPSVIAHPVNAP
jgi:nicotinamide phosphoribosyltransferase